MAFAKKFNVEVEVPKGCKAGDKFTVEVEAPEVEKAPRGQLAGIKLEDMTDDQLKREIINANSVLYKAKQRGADQSTIDANQARVDAAKAEKAKRTPVAATTATEATEDAPVEGDGTVDPESASEM